MSLKNCEMEKAMRMIAIAKHKPVPGAPKWGKAKRAEEG
jgi:hypothetical protein